MQVAPAEAPTPPTPAPAAPAAPAALAALTHREKILLGGAALAPDGAPFRSEHLAMALWRLFPESFQLGGYEAPDTARIFPKLAGNDGLVGRGWFGFVGDRTYRVTPAGLERLHAVLGPSLPRISLDVKGPLDAPPVRPAAPPGAASRARRAGPAEVVLPPPTDGQVARVAAMARGPAHGRFINGQPLGRAEAAAFWRVALWAKLRAWVTAAEAVEEALDAVCAAHRVGRAPAGAPDAKLCETLRQIHRLLAARHLSAETSADAPGGEEEEEEEERLFDDGHDDDEPEDDDAPGGGGRGHGNGDDDEAPLPEDD